MIVDPHFHFIEGAQAYLLDDLLADVATVPGITHLLFVECSFRWQGGQGSPSRRAIAETRAVARLAAEARRRGGPEIGTIGYVDLRDPQAEDLLQAHADVAEGGLRGIRNISTWHAREALRNRRMDPPRGLLADPDFVAGARLLARHGLPLDVWCYSEQLPELRALVGRVPELTVVLNHLGGPVDIGQGAGLGLWRREMDLLAQAPGLRVKLGGIGMPVFGFGFEARATPVGAGEMAEAWGPALRETIDRFGAGRCMFESNFPVDRAVISYADLWEAFGIVTAGLGEAARARLFGETAAAVYLAGPEA
ncbi:amidohydrolase family protein [Celeribacter indicus]|uniref:Amidohydrolase n=1 Tax=Celeribacter indicus TaxID=1208324 RepID=A0A0B5DTL8_9RHOB|nr:amidohydrolase family protein [Celeribacter indicus]AJE46778.1 amidohydrolase [Celeribacter indicus]SDX06180.1 Predicted metal-dependent hydrolase, TIM-barrel fold [Celeribacter indicus]